MAAPTAFRNPPQYSLRGLFCAVAVAGVVLAIGKRCGTIVGVAAGCVAVATALWMVALRRRPEARDARTLLAISCVYCTVNGFALLLPGDGRMFWYMMFSFPAPFVAFFFVGLFALCREASPLAIFGFWAVLAAAALMSLMAFAENAASC